MTKSLFVLMTSFAISTALSISSSGIAGGGATSISGIRIRDGEATSFLRDGGSGPKSATELVEEVSPDGYIHSCAKISTGKLFCWGSNQYGQIGIGTFSLEVTSLL